jgi:hypothetical protein
MASWVERLVVVTAVAALSSGCNQPCEIGAGHIGPVKLGASRADISAILKARYAVALDATPGTTPKLVAKPRTEDRNGRPAFVVYFDDSDHAFLIDGFGPCRTTDDIGPGATLGKARQVYGAGKIAPTDAGYLLSFSAMPGVGFLLDPSDIPVAVRDIPDDVFSTEHEGRILRLRNARIIGARVEAPDESVPDK